MNQKKQALNTSTIWRLDAPVTLKTRWSGSLRKSGRFVRGTVSLLLLQLQRRGFVGTLRKLASVAARPESYKHYLRYRSPVDLEAAPLLGNLGGYTFVPRKKPDDLETIIARMTHRPTFTIVVPLYNTPAELFSKMVESVLSQWYEYWELVLIDDNSPEKSVRESLGGLTDRRIKTILLNANLGISGATNAGLAKASGEYIVFLDHDDELTHDCLFELARCIEAEDADYVYSDEDKIRPDGGYEQPFFKPDWSPDTLMSTMYTCHVSCVRRTLAEDVGGLRSDFDGSQDWDFVLRVTEKAKRISHIPKVLYHWRMIPSSAARDITAKPYAVDAARRARVAALERRRHVGTVQAVTELPGYFRIHYALRGKPLISIIIPSKNNGIVLKRCVDTIVGRSTYSNVEIIVLDNGSTDEVTLEILRTLQVSPKIHIIQHDAPFNYSEINNIGVRAAKGSILLFLNDDTEVISPFWLETMAGYAQLDHIGAVGAKLLYPQGQKIQHAGVVNLACGPSHAFLLSDARDPCYFNRNLLEHNWIAVTGACLMIERSKFDRIGGFDEAFPVAYNDVELCFRVLQHGLFNVVCSAVELFHHESLTRGNDHENEQKMQRLTADRLRLFEKHPHYLRRDPYHNVNLHQNDPNFSIGV
ncbi:MAG TPA: glycosyltransferase family 2 protein [Acidocella sp.]|nr:glycosyltransferase family 2 protein [Acidocella sp.]